MTYNNFMITPDTPLSEERLFQIISTFQTSDLPTLKKLKNYYDGKQVIFEKTPVDDGRPDNQICINYTKAITDSYTGYMMGKPVSFVGDNIEDIREILDYNDIHEMMTEYLRQALIYGRAFLINYVDLEGKQRIQVLDSQECIPIYDDTIEHNLLHVVRCWIDSSKGELTTQVQYKVEDYGPSEVRYYDATADFTTYTLTHVEPNHYGQCPVTVFSLNRDEMGIFKPILSLQDAANTLISGQIDSYEDWDSAYLVLSGLNATDEESLRTMKKTKCILLPGEENCSASFLTKNISDTQAKDILDNINNKIFSIAQCPDFSDPNVFGNAASGISIKFKLLNFENVCANIESEMRKAIQRMIELFCTILTLVNEEATWRDVQIIFRRNLPVDIQEIVNIVNGLRGIVSTETLLSQIPFVENAQEELEKLKSENDFSELYSFDSHNHENEVTEDDNE